MITHEETRQLLAAFAIDAVRPHEHGQIETHLSRCPRCRNELDQHREVAAALGTMVEPPPKGVWSTISRRLSEQPGQDPPSSPAGRHAGRMHFPRGRFAMTASAAVGAAAVATTLGVGLIHADNRVAHLQGEVSEAARTTVVAAQEAPGHRIVKLDDAHHRHLAEFVVLRNGRGYLVTSKLPGLPAHETYQLWAVVNGQTISAGLLGRLPHLSTFTLVGAHPPFGLGVTIEPAGGVARPSGPMLAAGVA